MLHTVALPVFQDFITLQQLVFPLLSAFTLLPLKFSSKITTILREQARDFPFTLFFDYYRMFTTCPY